MLLVYSVRLSCHQLQLHVYADASNYKLEARRSMLNDAQMHNGSLLS